MPPGVRSALSVIGVGFLVAGSFGLATLAVQSVFRTAATEVAPRGAGLASGARVGAADGDVASAFEVPAYSGSEPLRLEAFRGHPIVLNFWASWCPPCRAEARILEDAYLHYRSQGVVFIGIDMQNDTWGESRVFLRRHGITYPVGRDERGTVSRAYRVSALPTTYLISPDGRIHGTAFTGGFIDAKGARELAEAIERLLSM